MPSSDETPGEARDPLAGSTNPPVESRRPDGPLPSLQGNQVARGTADTGSDSTHDVHRRQRGGAFTPAQAERIERAVRNAQEQSGLVFGVAVGPSDESDLRDDGERGMARLVDGTDLAAVLLLVDPDARRLEVVTSATARRRVPDEQAALAALSVASSVGVGDLTGGIVTGLRMLADAAGPAPLRAGSAQGQFAGS